MSIDFRNTKELLESISLMKNERVRFYIDDLNEKFKDEKFSYNDYLRNKPLPLGMRAETRTVYNKLAKEHRAILRTIEKKTAKIPVLMFKMGMGMLVLIFLLQSFS